MYLCTYLSFKHIDYYTIMMKKILNMMFLLGCCIPVCAVGTVTNKTIAIEVSNKWEKAKVNEPVVIKISDLKALFSVRSATIWDGNKEVPSQTDDLNGDGKADELAFVLDVPAKTTKVLKVTISSEKAIPNRYPSKVYAELLLRDKQIPISSITTPTGTLYNQLHHHGPAFESELAAYRLYFDKKQTVDIYGKFNKGFEVKESGWYPTDEQLKKGFGDDVLRVNSSCGVGALKGWDGKKALHIEPVSDRTAQILAYGPVRTIVDMVANNWEYQGTELNMINRYTLYAGHRDANVEVIFNKPLVKETFCTGVMDIKDSKAWSDHKGLVGVWGTDWPVNDTIKYAKETVGLATCIPQHLVKQEAKDKENYLYIIGASGKASFNYQIVFTSLKETFGYKTKEAWFAYIQEWKKELEHPCLIIIK